MVNFHEDKLWQEAYVILMNIHEVMDDLEDDSDSETIEALLEASQNVAAKIADGLSRLDHRVGKELIYDSVGLIAIARTQLAVAWGRGLFDDENFKNLDTKYANLSSSLQQYK